MSDNQSKYIGISSRDAYGATLIELAKEDQRIVGLTADLANSVRMDVFQKEFPDRMFNMGIAEQNMMGAAAGLALVGKIPFVSTFAAFASMRSHEQARTDIAYNSLPVKICASHGGFGLAVGGATHHALEDLSIFRDMPNMQVFVPADSVEASAIVKAIVKTPGPAYLRLSRPTEPTVYTQDEPYVIGKARVVRKGKDITLMACGGSVGYSVQAAEILAEKGVSVRVVNFSTIKPIDRAEIVASAQKTPAIMTVEEHSIIGGLGSSVAEVLAEEGVATKFHRHGLQDIFTTSGPYNDLLGYYKLDGKGIAETVASFLKK